MRAFRHGGKKGYVDIHITYMLYRGIFSARLMTTEAPTLTGTKHALDRASIRLVEGELKQAITVSQREWANAYNAGHRAVAVVALDLSQRRMTDNTGYESNGDMVVLIIVQGQVKTAYLRRSTQPMDKAWVQRIGASHQGGLSKVKWARGTEAAKARNTRAYKKGRR